ncbi:MAG: TolC family protein [Mangrovibacterium sp.]
MKRTILIAAILVLGFNLSAQTTIDTVLSEIEKNNTSLAAFRKSIDAEKIGAKTGMTPQNPEVEFNYLFGNPSAIGNRTDFSIKQSFDFPTAYVYKSQISNLKNEQVELEYTKQRAEVLYQARVLCARLIYYNALNIELGKSRDNALKVAEAYKTKFGAGDVGILEYNKAQVTLLEVSKKLENNEIEQNALLSELALLNGGNAISFADSQFPLQAVPADFDQWYALAEANNPLLQWVKQEITISEKQVKLNSAMSLPKLYGGYMSEKVVGQKYQGVTLGLTIPLWENKNTVNYAKAKNLAMQSVESDTKLQFYNQMKATHTKLIALQNNAADYRSKLVLYSNSELLGKALEKGEISLTEYLYELSLYYESIYTLLELEMTTNLAFLELTKFQY